MTVVQLTRAESIPDEPEVGPAPAAKKAKTSSSPNTQTSKAKNRAASKETPESMSQSGHPLADPLETVYAGQQTVLDGLDQIIQQWKQRGEDAEEGKKMNDRLMQALDDVLEKEKKVKELEEKLARRNTEFEKIEAENKQLKQKNEELEGKWSKMKIFFDEQK